MNSRAERADWCRARRTGYDATLSQLREKARIMERRGDEGFFIPAEANLAKDSHFVLLLATAACLFGSQAVAPKSERGSSLLKLRQIQKRRGGARGGERHDHADDWGIAHVRGRRTRMRSSA